jgi:HPt (histidine-containing phosphotransfer) domain-containing protein
MTSTDDPGNGDSMKNGVIDWSVLEDYLAIRKSGAHDPRQRVITIYLYSSPTLMEAIKTAFIAADRSLLTKSAHTLKSSSLYVGARGVGALCAELERTGKTGSIEDLKNLVDLLEAQYAAVTATFNDALQHMGK